MQSRTAVSTQMELLDYAGVSKQTVPCACCGSADHVEAIRGDRYRFGLRTVVCAGCGLIFTNPRPDRAWFDDFYRQWYRRFYEDVETPTADYLERDWISGRHGRNVEFLASRLPDEGSLLDVGCAEGTFLSVFAGRRPRWRVFGIEPNERFAQFAREHYRLPAIVSGTFDELPRLYAPASFDLLTAGHVLEHVLEPDRFFAVARALLAPGGLLFIDVPDAEGESRGIGNLHIAHVYHFSEHSLRSFLTKHGFAVDVFRKGTEEPPWTMQVLARKAAEPPPQWQPLPVDAQRLARAFARHCRQSWPSRLRGWVRPLRRLFQRGLDGTR